MVTGQRRREFDTKHTGWLAKFSSFKLSTGHRLSTDPTGIAPVLPVTLPWCLRRRASIRLTGRADRRLTSDLPNLCSLGLNGASAGFDRRTGRSGQKRRAGRRCRGKREVAAAKRQLIASWFLVTRSEELRNCSVSEIDVGSVVWLREGGGILFSYLDESYRQGGTGCQLIPCWYLVGLIGSGGIRKQTQHCRHLRGVWRIKEGTEAVADTLSWQLSGFSRSCVERRRGAGAWYRFFVDILLPPQCSL
ncbi:hypothetical protein R1flu_001633 [Riccia fluitans]|uniref:Uncharacterized protein n=1 Tax=Riccia fluitans TaxID=41844 RepID=A0ABD1Y3T8_9MARC